VAVSRRTLREWDQYIVGAIGPSRPRLERLREFAQAAANGEVDFPDEPMRLELENLQRQHNLLKARVRILESRILDRDAW
jgi:hypothetical protein